MKLGRRVVGAMVVLACVASCSDHEKSSTPAPTTKPPPTATTTVPSSLPQSGVPLPRPPSGRITRVPPAIPADCSRDVTKALQATVDATPDNATLRLGSSACYRIDGTLVVKRRHRMLIDGNGATLRAYTRGDRNRAHLVVEGGSDITLRRVVVRGANPRAGAYRGAYVPKLEAQAGFRISGASRVLLDRVAASDVYGDFVYVGPDRGTPSDDVRIEHSSFVRSSRHGIVITSGTNVAIRQNRISEVGLSMFDLEANSRSASIQHVEIVGNVTGAAHNYWLANKGADARIGDISIVGNTMSEVTGGLVFVFGEHAPYRGPYLIERNHFFANDATHDEKSKGAFFFAGAKGVTIRNNAVTFPPGMPAVELRDTHTVAVSRNDFRGAGELVIRRAGSSDIRVT